MSRGTLGCGASHTLFSLVVIFFIFAKFQLTKSGVILMFEAITVNLSLLRAGDSYG